MVNLQNIVNSLYISSSLALATGCIYDLELPEKLLVDFKFSQDEVDLIGKAVNEWAKATNSIEVEIPLAPGFDSDEEPFERWGEPVVGEGRVYKISTQHPGYADLKQEIGKDVNGASEKYAFIAFIEDKIEGGLEKGTEAYENIFYRVALHEYGHFLGLAHLTSPTALMTPGTGVLCIDEETLNYYCSQAECGPNKHPTCEEE